MKQGTTTLRGVQPVSGACGLLAGLLVASGEATISFDNFHAIPPYSHDRSLPRLSINPHYS